MRRHSSGDFLVTFRGVVWDLMSGEIMTKNLPLLRAEAYSQGKLSAEALKEEGNDSADDTDLIAGLYVRASALMQTQDSH